MIGIDILDDEPRRPIWVVTLADLMLLLVGFFVFLQANRTLDGHQIASGLREGFGVAKPVPMSVDSTIVTGFASGSAALPDDGFVAWASAATADPRTVIRITGGTDAAEADPATGSAAILAADRARAVAVRLAQVVPPARLSIDTRPGAGRSVQLNLAFAGETR